LVIFTGGPSMIFGTNWEQGVLTTMVFQ